MTVIELRTILATHPDHLEVFIETEMDINTLESVYLDTDNADDKEMLVLSFESE